MPRSYKQLMNGITTFIFDIDGVLTDGSLQVSSEGDVIRTVNIRDYQAMKAAILSGYRISIICEQSDS